MYLDEVPKVVNMLIVVLLRRIYRCPSCLKSVLSDSVSVIISVSQKIFSFKFNNQRLCN